MPSKRVWRASDPAFRDGAERAHLLDVPASVGQVDEHVAGRHIHAIVGEPASDGLRAALSVSAQSGVGLPPIGRLTRVSTFDSADHALENPCAAPIATAPNGVVSGVRGDDCAPIYAPPAESARQCIRGGGSRSCRPRDRGSDLRAPRQPVNQSARRPPRRRTIVVAAVDGQGDDSTPLAGYGASPARPQHEAIAVLAAPIGRTERRPGRVLETHRTALPWRSTSSPAGRDPRRAGATIAFGLEALGSSCIRRV